MAKSRNELGQFTREFTDSELNERKKIKHKEYMLTSSGKKVGKKARSKHREKRRQWFFEYKQGLSCVYCGTSNPLCIDMDHIDPATKKGVPSTMVTNGTAWELVLEELSKCQPVCRNCHNIKSILEAGKLKNQDISPYVPEPLMDIFISQSHYHKCEHEPE